MYYKRHLEEKIIRLSKYFKVVLVVGARQVGKSTILSHLFPEYKHFTFDPVQDVYKARKDPDLFLKNFPGPLILDEVQYVPELLSSLKRKVDQMDGCGLYFLTGSQNMSVLKTVSESLAGRVAIVQLNQMNFYELQKKSPSNWLNLYLENPEDLLFKNFPTIDINLLSNLFRGGFPALLETPDDLVTDYFSSYVQTYIERDIRTFENIKDLNLFGRFLGIISSLTAQEINHSHLGRELGITPKTARSWLSLMNYTYLWIELFAYDNNPRKKIIKKRKGYITDTGLACYLQRIKSVDSLAQNPMLGSLFETFCVNTILSLKSTLIGGFNMYHWRTKGGAEVDIILEKDGILYPIEIKYKSHLSKHDTRGLQAFRKSYPDKKIAKGLIIYAGDLCYQVSENDIAIPWNICI